MRRVVVRSLAVLAAGAAVLVAVLYVASTVDARSPEVIAFELTQPVSGEQQTALITTSIEVAFNEPVLVDAGTEALTIDPHVDGAISWSGSTMIFTPRDPLALETEYLVTVGTGLRDAAGNAIGDPPPTFAFRTAGRPAVVDTTPADGDADVPLSSPITIEFATLMDTGAVERALTVSPSVAHQLEWSGEVLEIVPVDGLRAGTEYEVEIAADASDVAGVRLAEPMVLRFRTVAGGLEAHLVPGDGVDGISPASPIAVVFDRPIDPDSVTADQLRIAPDVAGTLEVVTIDGEPIDGSEVADEPRVLRFMPSGSLPLNTTFEVTLGEGVRGVDGGHLAERVTWSFTTGAPAATLSNQVTFVSDRAGVANVWAMNPDGSGQHQVSSELTAVLDYAIAPDGSHVIVGDGRRLVMLRADGSARAVLTDEGHLEFDATFAPNGERIAFGRADAETGAGLGLWLRPVDGGEPVAVEPPPEIDSDPTPTPPGEAEAEWLRAPRFSPDGQALAYLGFGDGGSGFLAILELPAERLTRVEVTWAAAPVWLRDSSGVLITTAAHPSPLRLPTAGEAVGPIRPASPDANAISRLNRSGTELAATPWQPGTLLAVRPDGALAYLDARGELRVAQSREDRDGEPVRGLTDESVRAAAFAPGEEQLVVVLARSDDPESGSGRLELVDLQTGDRTNLADEASRPTWQP